ncbi:hypothetical protein AgCh_003283 [Apium graveolens]
MESSASSRSYVPSKSKKRVFPGESSMDPDVIEIPPPVDRRSKGKGIKINELIDQEIIDVDGDENSITSTEGMDTKSYKDKRAITINSLGTSGASAHRSGNWGQSLKKSSAPGSQNVIDLDGFACDFSFLNDDYVDTYSDCTPLFDDNPVYEDEYESLQSHFDNIDIPPGVEAPVSWFSGPAQNKITSGTTNSSTRLNPKPSPGVLLPGKEASHSLWSVDPWGGKSTTNSLTMGTPIHPVGHPHKAVMPSFWPNAEKAQREKIIAASKHLQYKTRGSGWGFDNKSTASGVASSHGLHNPPGFWKKHSGVEPDSFRSARIHKKTKQISSIPYIPNASKAFPVTGTWFNYDSSMYPMASSNYPPHYNPLLNDYLYFEELAHDPFELDSYAIKNNAMDLVIPFGSSSRSQNHAKYLGTPSGSSSAGQQNDAAKHVNGDEILLKFQQFQKFDIVQDTSDHHYVHNGSSLKQPSKKWAKKIQEEWKILEKDLPDTIFVRAYESRMDLLRAVIIGAEGTPYHDGLFFFDVSFPDNYPLVPPNVYYHSRGLRLNPNLYENGKVCLSLLNTWSGSQKEMWIPNLSTMLQVLVSIQGLILNAKPYFNEPAYAGLSGSPQGEISSHHYNESTFIFSLKTVVCTLRNKPKHFEDFVVGHFFKRASDILVACKAYMDGAQVGCLVKGGVQDVDEGDKSCSENFKATLGAYMKPLVAAFTQIGVKDCEQFIPPPQKGSSQTGIRPAGQRLMSPALKGVNFF